MLKKITIENYRSCLRASLDLHPNLSVLIGPNSSGKTNILQAILLLRKIGWGREPFRTREDSTAVTSRIKATFVERSAEVKLNASVDAYADRSNNDVVMASRQKWSLKSKGGERASLKVPLPLFAGYLSDVERRKYFMHFGSRGRGRFLRELGTEVPAWANPIMKEIGNFCAGIKYYGASQFTSPGLCPVSFEIEEEGSRRRLFESRGHARVLYDMYSAQKGGANDRYEQFMDIVRSRGLRLIDDLKFREVRTSSSEYSVRVGGRVEVRKRHKLLVIPQFRLGRQKLSPNQLSEGTFKTLALLFHVVTEKSTALLIEEPEVCVHHGLLSSILELVKEYSRHKQMVLSTHSDYVLDHVRPENVFRVTFDRSSGTTARHIRKTMNVKEYAALKRYLEEDGNLGEFWREGGLGDRA
jgi:AAA domain, putative AbiEii toxin, Type IV TA system/AAA ATPase domain